MAFDLEPGGDPRGPWCPKCKLPVMKGQPQTKMTFPEDPDGSRGMSGLWHGECSRPFWDTFSHVLDMLGGLKK
ncbi:hypothetical protein [Caulobacter sp. 17J65-9]|uniref:hypothetical protein n=1 Tax=Caulobacter sp. 17J65-9 TaxID=2709382 RepID=UPI0013CAA985|nr:hypothetical protein [Caulobacter sp. 17J65-9]NEX91952.1 hypothetical protein [Caulobacter sp. 17J65-9]